MLNEEQRTEDRKEAMEPLSYGSYLRVPELLLLQSPLGDPPVPDEMLFIIVQQAQELWFKQILFDLHRVIDDLTEGNVLNAVRILIRLSRIMQVLGDEVDILAMMPPREFHRFRGVLSPASGFESHQFRELEYASGLDGQTFIKVLEKHLGLASIEDRWPTNLRQAAYTNLAAVASDPTDAWTAVYDDAERYPELFALAEALSEYEVYFGVWRFKHVKLVERSIGGHVPGTGGSAGSGYLQKTLQYRFFPELWEARNRLTQMHPGT
ncbi:MAG TPA: tryptophan 2,3-dioxygenase family protein [Chloroflexia bacterium]|nr:tryptophan 2,3-dioxygenase family protein [Chloroflexia bacterium]